MAMMTQRIRFFAMSFKELHLDRLSSRLDDGRTKVNGIYPGSGDSFPISRVSATTNLPPLGRPLGRSLYAHLGDGQALRRENPASAVTTYIRDGYCPHRPAAAAKKPLTELSYPMLPGLTACFVTPRYPKTLLQLAFLGQQIRFRTAAARGLSIYERWPDQNVSRNTKVHRALRPERF